ncbi:SLC13 family permease [Larsenimonas suaedae]|uniref:DASS family sodium-coupled anion symporter n=1 Tax=Larsenimonas suaedae TaxID=1851019 RepID=A0ABU1GVC9_9GAMM|nr:DASS family sodium-coupled anion symporter [Larsenimonas suaedae]MCM2971293.1 DASS family sodium-coupled anion symporter [Larsenimonas suaedae]MDR5896003.1 DASS family sodium-coupled anion symporter [Larsenimonas suaedae]
MSTQETSTMAPRIGLVLGLIFAISVLIIPAPGDIPSSAWHCIGLALLMATWWSTEAIPIPVTSLLPIILIPAMGIGDVKTATAPYANPIIFLFLGGFLLGLAMQYWNLHKRLALKILLMVGQSPKRQVAGFMLATGFISMWVSNTATAIMMLPIGMSVITMLTEKDAVTDNRYATSLLLAIAYAASIGGVATLIGTPPNALLAGYLSNDQSIDIGFGQWMVVGLPIAIVMMLFAWFWLTRGLGNIEDTDSSALFREKLNELGPMSHAEKRVAIAFVLAAGFWIFRPLLNAYGLPWLSDTGIAMIIGVGLFLIPSGQEGQSRLMSWDNASDLPWGVLLLFGGGLSLAGAVKSSGLATWIAEHLAIFGNLPLLLLIMIVVMVIIFLTEVTSNTATAAAFLPLLGALAISLDQSLLLITVPAALAASCAFMMPVATPPNAIVFATGKMKIKSMISAGFALNIAGIFIVTLLSYFLISLAWQ